MTLIAVVTGANKGIGYGIVKALCQHNDPSDVIVYLTARSEERGRAACDTLAQALGDGSQSKLRFHQLDVTDTASCHALARHLHNEHGGLDILVNNAAIPFVNDDPGPFAEKAKTCLNTNYFGIRNTCDALFPLLKPGSRVVHLAGRLGILNDEYSEQVRHTLKSAELTECQLDQLVRTYIETAVDNKHRDAGLPASPLAFAKAAVLALTAVQHRELSGDSDRPGIVVNACCPGFTWTDFTRRRWRSPPAGMRLKSVEEAADTPVYLATLLPRDCHTIGGQFVAERTVIQW